MVRFGKAPVGWTGRREALERSQDRTFLAEDISWMDTYVRTYIHDHTWDAYRQAGSPRFSVPV